MLRNTFAWITGLTPPQLQAHKTYNRLFALYQRVYFSLGRPGTGPVGLGDILPELRMIAGAAVRQRVP